MRVLRRRWEEWRARGWFGGRRSFRLGLRALRTTALLRLGVQVRGARAESRSKREWQSTKMVMSGPTASRMVWTRSSPASAQCGRPVEVNGARHSSKGAHLMVVKPLFTASVGHLGKVVGAAVYGGLDRRGVGIGLCWRRVGRGLGGHLRGRECNRRYWARGSCARWARASATAQRSPEMAVASFWSSSQASGVTPRICMT